TSVNLPPLLTILDRRPPCLPFPSTTTAPPPGEEESNPSLTLARSPTPALQTLKYTQTQSRRLPGRRRERGLYPPSIPPPATSMKESPHGCFSVSINQGCWRLFASLSASSSPSSSGVSRQNQRTLHTSPP
ncbi:hypothetical protein EMPG_15890, partial [Blastomyces silverae]